MTGAEGRVEDARTLQRDDRVRLVIEGVVTAGGEYMSIRVEPYSTPWLFTAEYINDSPTVEVYLLPKPLPPEPPVGTMVLAVDDGLDTFGRGHTGWSSARQEPMPWAELLAKHGPVRLLGDPIEAP